MVRDKKEHEPTMERMVLRLPMTELWDENGPVPAAWIRDLMADDIRELLRVGPVRFVVLDVGAAPKWVTADECFQFWKSEVQPHVADPSGARLEDFPSGYCYFASEWRRAVGPPVVVLSIAH